MKLLVVILNDVELQNDILSLMTETGITHATIIDSEGMGHHLAYEIPIFAGLRDLAGKSSAHNKTILAFIKNDEVIKEFQLLLKEMDIDFNKPETGIMFVLEANEIT